MTILTVTTALDTMNALDGLTSLREALASASAYDVVRFAGFLSGQTINLTLGTLDPGAGGAILVQGDVDGDGAGDVTIAAGAGQAVMAVGIGQLAQFDNMRFTNGGFTASAAMDGGAGGGGANGTNGANGAEGALGTGQAGGDGTSGGPGGTGAKGSDGGTGSVAVGAFLNAGTLILDGCTFEMGSLTGGAGGAGGIGGTGGMGGNAGNGGLGASNDFGDGGLGGNGGAAGAGGQGGFGGFGGYGGFAAAVVNLASGELSLGVNAFLGAGYSGGAGGAGGDGGLGGAGGIGGQGGDGGNSAIGAGGNGGNGGNGGDGGNGGYGGFGGNGGAAAPVINYGTMNIYDVTLFSTVSATGGVAGGGGHSGTGITGGFEGTGGFGGVGFTSGGNNGAPGNTGFPGGDGNPGSAGNSGDASSSLLNYGGLSQQGSIDLTSASLLYFGGQSSLSAEAGDAGSDTITVYFNRIGNLSGAVTANYVLDLGADPLNIDLDDFAVATSLTGTVTFGVGQDTTAITLSFVRDNFAEGSEYLTVRYTGVAAGSAAATADFFELSAGDDDNGTAAAETLTGSNSSDNINGLSGNDIINGGGGADFIYGDADNDSLNGGTGADFMNGGTGNDTYYVDNIGDTTDETGGGGTGDYVFSTVSFTAAAGIERLYLTGAGNVNATGRAGQNDILVGNSGNNIINGLSGNDVMRGGLGNDTYYVDSISDTTDEVTGGGGTGDYVFSSVSFTASQGIERLYLQGSGNINATGTALQNDILVGNSGNNVINGLSGNDVMRGGLGNDTYYVDSISDTTDEVTGGGGNDFVYSSVSFTASQGIDRLYLTGSSNINGSGRDAQNDILGGNTGSNVLSGLTGNDTLIGGLGNDTLSGGAGLDIFRFDTAFNAATNMDTITDFVAVDDLIQLENAIFTALTLTGTLAAGAFNTGSAATQADDRIIYNTVTGALLYDADGLGGGAGVQFAQFSSHPAGVSAADFLVY